MARLARMVVAGQAHLVQWRSLAGVAAFGDAADRAALLAGLLEAARLHGLVLHAWAVRPAALELMARPESAGQLALVIQQVGRKYVHAYNMRRGRRGTLWSGRFRSCPVEPGAPVLLALRFVDAPSSPSDVTTADHRLGGGSGRVVVDPPEYWALGNTPFDRERSYREQLSEPVPAADRQRIERALRGGWALGSPAFGAELAARAERPTAPRPRGRPARTR